CKFMSWDIPTGKKCPKCQSAMVKVGGKEKCSNKDCEPKKKTTWEYSADDLPPLMDEPVFNNYDK
ncbi:MAG: hypothetical protein IJY38_03595, partial [Clostridia bacterium]|nr:hypothetical protein [Clostridia bacterium]